MGKKVIIIIIIIIIISISVATNAGQTAIDTGKVENDEAIPTGFLVCA